MKLRNKKTGETVKFSGFGVTVVGEDGKTRNEIFDSLAELNAEWKDYEEPKKYWFMSGRGEVRCIEDENTDFDKDHKEIGNYFETYEDAEQAVEKLKIYNKLKQKGFVFSGWYYSTEGQLVILADNHEFSETEPEDLTELFGDKIC